ncbi:MAG: hypothetical protein KC996_04900 [Phycisphaerales bacterium]|nr:hypothetical protein [Phycisphaerales bacterium]
MSTLEQMKIDVDRARRDILDPSRTAHVVRGFLDEEQLGRYFAEMNELFAHAPRSKEKPTSVEQPDFVLPWLYSEELKRFMVHRIYCFPCNETGTYHGEVHAMVMRSRDEIESVWNNTPVYRAKNYGDLHIITKYEDGSDGYPRHTDVPFEHPTPMLQCWLQLTTPGIDFDGGDLLMHPPGGGVISGFGDLGITSGDLVFFDKRTEHEVTACDGVEGGRGRWISIIGAKAPMDA